MVRLFFYTGQMLMDLLELGDQMENILSLKKRGQEPCFKIW